jgi:hypothetical protein
LEVCQPPNKILNVVTIAENRYSSAQGLLELNHEQKKDQNHNFSIEKLENNIDGEIFNKNEIMIDCSQFTAPSSGISGLSASHSFSTIAADCSDVVDPGAYATQEEIITVEDYESLYDRTTHQSCPQPNSYEFIAPAIIWPASQSNYFQGDDHWKDRLNFRYDVNLGVPTYIDINSSHQLPHIDEGGGAGDQWDLSRISHEAAEENPIPSIFGGGEESGRIQFECEGGARQVIVNLGAGGEYVQYQNCCNF